MARCYTTRPGHVIVCCRVPTFTILGVPLAQMCNEHFKNARARILMKNMAYVGALAALLDLDRDVITTLVEEIFAAKKALIQSNMEAIELGYDYATEHFDCPHWSRGSSRDG